MRFRLKEVREAKRMTIQELSTLTNLSRVTISKIENNKVADIKTTTLSNLAKVLGVTCDELFLD